MEDRMERRIGATETEAAEVSDEKAQYAWHCVIRFLCAVLPVGLNQFFMVEVLTTFSSYRLSSDDIGNMYPWLRSFVNPSYDPLCKKCIFSPNLCKKKLGNTLFPLVSSCMPAFHECNELFHRLRADVMFYQTRILNRHFRCNPKDIPEE